MADLEKPIEVTRRRTDDHISNDQEEREREAGEDFDVLHRRASLHRKPADQSDIAPVLKIVLQYFFEIFRDDKNYQSKRSKKFDANAPKIKFYRPKKNKAKKAEKLRLRMRNRAEADRHAQAFIHADGSHLRPDLTDAQLEQAGASITR